MATHLSESPVARPGAAPVLVSMAMGYGHLRAAHALAEELGTEVLHADRPPLADGDEQALWEAARRLYEWTSRAAQLPILGRPMRWLLEAVTAIPRLEPRRDLAASTRAVRMLGRLIDRGMGRGLARHLAAAGAPLLTTYFAPALAVDDARRLGVEGAGAVDGPPVYCVVTDVDLARAWVGRRPHLTRVRYLVPSRRAVERLRAYGVPAEQIVPTGFPLPGRLLGGPGLAALRRHLARRLVRLDPSGAFRDEFRHEIDQFLGPLDLSQEGAPPTLAYVVGGAGAQAEIAERLLGALASWVDDGRLRIALVAGTRPEVAASFERWTTAAGLAAHLGDAVEVVYEPEVESYFRRFNRLLEEVDVLWTKPSELTFFAALGLPLVLTPPLGVQERHNRRWAQQRGAALRQARPRHASEWLHEWLRDGTLAMAAWNGYLRLPKFGLYQILEQVGVATPAADGPRATLPRRTGALPPLR
jgi:hypothetical protein